jgi:hypothetical protein
MWTKNATDVIFSQNTCYNITYSNGGIGQGTGGQYDPKYVWFLFNEIYNAKAGIHIASSSSGGGGPWYAVGNIIYNIQSDTCNEYDYGAIGYRNEGGFYAFHNSVYDVDSFLTLPPTGGVVVVKDNIFASKKSGSCPAIDSTGKAPTLDYNLYSSDGWGIEYNGSAYSSISEFSSATGQEAHRRTGNPLFNSAPSDLSLQSSSPAVGNAYQAAETAYTSFSTRYGRSIQYDFSGVARPIDTWDIGAYEYGSTATGRPAAPQNLRIIP